MDYMKTKSTGLRLTLRERIGTSERETVPLPEGRRMKDGWESDAGGGQAPQITPQLKMCEATDIRSLELGQSVGKMKIEFNFFSHMNQRVQ